MRFCGIHLQDYRNIETAFLEFTGPRQFFLGKNGQGKTNLLEALHLVSALRSFRTQDTKAFIRLSTSRCELFYKISHEVEGHAECSLNIGGNKKKVLVDGEPITKLGELMGRFPTVVLSAEDMAMLRGAPSLRRRFLDMVLSTTDHAYYQNLRDYFKALQERNSLLKKGERSDPLYAPYEQILSQTGTQIAQKRTTLIQEIGTRVGEYYTAFCKESEAPEFLYKPDITSSDLLTQLKENRERDLILKSTQRGPHRDDITFKLKGKPAKEFASEGQQRALVLALRMAQVSYYKERMGVQPVVLMDDVLGQLDPDRTAAFWNILDDNTQVIATGTVLPKGDWQVFEVEEGKFSPVNNLALVNAQ